MHYVSLPTPSPLHNRLGKYFIDSIKYILCTILIQGEDLLVLIANVLLISLLLQRVLIHLSMS